MHGKCVDCWVDEEGELATLEIQLDFEVLDGTVLCFSFNHYFENYEVNFFYFFKSNGPLLGVKINLISPIFIEKVTIGEKTAIITNIPERQNSVRPIGRAFRPKKSSVQS